jgi:site-specific DNA-cytosine methylase
VPGPGDAGAPRVQAQRHVGLPGRRPRVVFLAVKHERRDVPAGEVAGLVRGGEQVGGHGGEAGRVVGEHALPEELHDRDWHAVRDRLRFEGAMPYLGHAVAAGLGGGGVEHVEHEPQLIRAGTGQRRRARAHQGQRPRGVGTVQHRLTRDQAAERVTEQVHRGRRPRQRHDVLPEFAGLVGAGRVRALCLILAAHVHRDDPAPGGG